MIWPFLFAVLFVIFAWRSVYDVASDFLEYYFSTFFLVIFTALAFGVGLGFASLVGLAVPKHWTGPETAKLVSLRDGDGISGHFFLGTGSIGATQYYFFYKEAGQGYQPGKVAVADNVIVFEEKRQGGELKAYTYQFVNPSFGWIAIDWQGQKYEFVIPEGSLKKNFVLR
ncbi:MAG: hypothetical protein AAB498_01935 [Patescibacteria group bacterium]